MQHLKEFLTRIQTFDLRVIEDDIHMEWGTKEKKHVKVYDLTYQTPYYDSFSYRSELRVLKDMAFIDLMTLDKERIQLQLAELAKVRERFKDFWRSYHDHYSEMTKTYNRSFVFSVRLEYLFIVNGLQPASAEIEISGKFAEDLGESAKLREKFLMELIYAAETALKPKRSEAEFKEWLESERQKREALQTAVLPVTDEAKAVTEPVATTQTTLAISEITDQPEMTEAEIVPEVVTANDATLTVPENRDEPKIAELPEISEQQLAIARIAGYYPTFKTGAAKQLFSLLKEYFVSEEHPALEKLLLNDEAPVAPLLFRGAATQLADAFKQLYDANLIIGCRKSDLEKWIAPKFLYLNPQSEPRDLPEGYLHSLISEKTRPCKSPILKIEHKEDGFFIFATPRSKK